MKPKKLDEIINRKRKIVTKKDLDEIFLKLKKESEKWKRKKKKQ